MKPPAKPAPNKPNSKIEEAIEITQKEANNIIEFFESNNLVNNADKAAIF